MTTNQKRQVRIDDLADALKKSINKLSVWAEKMEEEEYVFWREKACEELTDMLNLIDRVREQ